MFKYFTLVLTLNLT